MSKVFKCQHIFCQQESLYHCGKWQLTKDMLIWFQSPSVHNHYGSKHGSRQQADRHGTETTAESPQLGSQARGRQRKCCSQQSWKDRAIYTFSHQTDTGFKSLSCWVSVLLWSSIFLAMSLFLLLCHCMLKVCNQLFDFAVTRDCCESRGWTFKPYQDYGKLGTFEVELNALFL